MAVIGTVMPVPRYEAQDNNGDPVNGGLLYTYKAGTTTPIATFSDAALLVPNTNPIVLDAGGRAAVFLAPGVYKFVQADANDVILWTQDNISAYRPWGSAAEGGDNVFEGDVLINGGLNVTEDLHVFGHLTVDKTTTLNSTLTVTGGGLKVTGGLENFGDLINSGKAEIGQSLTVQGPTVLNNNVTLGDDILDQVNVNGLLNITQFTEKVVDAPIASGVLNINVSKATYFRVPLTEDCTVNLVGLSEAGMGVVGRIGQYSIIFKGDGTQRSVTMPFSWIGSGPPTIPANGTTIVTILYVPGVYVIAWYVGNGAF